jgi:uncharacterized protein (DUF427 family)
MTTDAPTRPRLKIEDTAKRIRAYLDGELVIDTTNAKLVWEKPYYPTYYFPRGDVNESVLVASPETKKSPSRGLAELFTVKGATRATVEGAYAYPRSPIEELRGLVAFRWDALDHWFEEDEEVFVHARDPYTRIDILPSSRRVTVEINGVQVADTTNAMMLFETGLPTRYYMPKTDVRLDLMTPTATATSCPYKGTARYWSITANGETFTDHVWGYDTPLPESSRIAGLVSFYNEKADIYIDGELQDRPKTKFS